MIDEEKLSEDQIDKIADRVVEKLETKLYKNVGSGLISLAMKGLLLIIIILASYGAGHSFFK